MRAPGKTLVPISRDREKPPALIARMLDTEILDMSNGITVSHEMPINDDHVSEPLETLVQTDATVRTFVESQSAHSQV